MKYSKFIKAPITLLITFILSIQGPLCSITLADTDFSQSNEEKITPGTVPFHNMGIDNSEVDIPNQSNLDIQAILEERALEVAKIVNANANLGLDYVPNIKKDDALEALTELSVADIIEYDSKLKNQTGTVTASNVKDDYRSHLAYLIENNVLSRDNNYIYTADALKVTQDRTLSNGTKNVKQSDVVSKSRYYDDTLPVSRTDLLVGLMKTKGVINSKPIAIMHPYKRMLPDFKSNTIITEPAQLSPYTNTLGSFGLLQYLDEITIHHDVYNQVEYLISPDVIELYLKEALDKGIITDDDLDLVSSSDARNLTNEDLSSTFFTDSCLNTTEPCRQFYRELAIDKNKKTKKLIIVEDNKEVNTINGGALYPWGNSYSYSAGACTFSNPYSNTPVQITKRLSRVEIQNGIKDSTRPEDTGYCYLKNEEMSLLEAYVLVANYMKKSGYEQALSQSDLDIFSARYAINVSGATEEELNAVKYLVVQGVIDGNDPTLPYAYGKTFTNSDLVKILYYVHNVKARYNNMIPVTDLDVEMSKKGYGKADISVNDIIPVTDIETQEITAIDANGNAVTQEQRMIKDRVKDPTEYDYIYVRLPKESQSDTGHFVGLYTYGSDRVKVEPLDRALNGGKVTETLSNSNYKPISDKDVKDGIDYLRDIYVFKDREGYIWHRYIVHKDLSANMFLQCYVNTNLKNIEGISGPGVYYLNDKTGNEFTKFSYNEAKTYFGTEDLYKYVIQADLELANILKKQTVANNTNNIQKSFNKSNLKINLLWSQFALADPSQQTARNVIATFSEAEALDVYYNGQEPLLIKEGSDYKINPKAIPDYLQSKYSVTKTSDGKVQVVYEAPSANASLFSLTERSKMKTKTQDPIDTMSGYVKVKNKDGQDVVMVTEAELKALGIEVVGDDKGTGRTLYNPKTGQYAFFNSEDSNTLIGNNVTFYNSEDMLCIASDGTKFYNLRAAMEILSDTDTIIKRAGNDILVSLIDANTTQEKYRLVNIVNNTDVTSSTQIKGDIVDRTYIASSDSFQTVYMSLSALTGYCSNFIYYKNRKDNHYSKALLVYKPRATLDKYVAKGSDGNYTQYDGSAGSVNNSLIDNTSSETYNDVKISGTTECLQAKDTYIKAMMGAPASSIDNTLISGDYDLSIVLFGEAAPDSEEAASDIKDFLFTLANEDQSTYVKLLKQTRMELGNANTTGVSNGGNEVLSKIDNVYHAANVKLDPKADIKLSYMKADTELGQNTSPFILHKASGNLYFRLTPQKLSTESITVTETLQSILGQRFYFNYDPSTINTTDYLAKNYISFRGYKVYENTPKGMIPLEVYGTEAGEVFNTLDTNNGVTSGEVKYNFPGKYYKLYMPANTSSNSNTVKHEQASSFIYNIQTTSSDAAVTDVGYGTTLTFSPYELTNEEVIKILYGSTDKATLQLQDYKDYTNEFLKVDLKVIETQGNLGMYASKIREALGLGSTAVKVGIGSKTLPATIAQFTKGCAVPNYEAMKKDYQLFSAVKKVSNKTKNYAIFLDVSSNFTDAQGITQTALSAEGYAYNNTDVKQANTVMCYVKSTLSDAGHYKVSTSAKNIDVIGANPITSFYTDLSNQIPNTVTLNKCDVIDASKWHDNGDGTYKFTGSLTDKSGVFIRPSITIPAGTTLVDANYNLIFSPNKNIRSEVFTQNNILNTLIMRAAIKSGEYDVTYLCEVEQGSIIKFSDTQDTYMVKVDSAQKFPGKVGEEGSTKDLKYVRLLSDILDDNQATNQEGSRLRYFEMNLLEKYYSRFYNLKVPYNFGLDNKYANISTPKVNFASILGGGRYRLPTTAEASLAAKVQSPLLEWYQKRDSANVYVMNVNTNEIGLPVNATTVQSSNTNTKLDIGEKQGDLLTYTAAIVSVKDLVNANQSTTTTELANTINDGIGDTSILFNVAPTVVVKEEDAALSNGTKVYKVVNYHDFGSMIFDSEGQFASYLSSKNTPMMDVTDILNAIKSDQYNADDYTNLTFSQRLFELARSIFTITVDSPFLILFIFVLHVTCWWILISFPLTRSTFERWQLNHGFNPSKWFTFGIVSIDKEFDIRYYIIFLIVTSCIAGILSTGIIQNLIFYLFTGNRLF